MEYYTTSLQHILAELERIDLIIQRQGITLCLDELARLFHLTPFDVDTILICLPPTQYALRAAVCLSPERLDQKATQRGSGSQKVEK